MRCIHAEMAPAGPTPSRALKVLGLLDAVQAMSGYAQPVLICPDVAQSNKPKQVPVARA